MGFDNRPRDGQPHTRTLHPVALVLAAIELVKDQHLLHVIDAGALVGDADFDVGAFRLGRDPDGRFRWRILGCILQ